jgi:hypothetical protein
LFRRRLEEVARLPPRSDPKAKASNLSLLRFKLKEGESAAEENFGITAVCESPEGQAIFDDGAPIGCMISLRELCRQTDFQIIVSRLETINNQLRDHLPREIHPGFPYVNGSVPLIPFFACVC